MSGRLFLCAGRERIKLTAVENGLRQAQTQQETMNTEDQPYIRIIAAIVDQ
jgi:hypothetical protein